MIDPKHVVAQVMGLSENDGRTTKSADEKSSLSLKNAHKIVIKVIVMINQIHYESDINQIPY